MTPSGRRRSTGADDADFLGLLAREPSDASARRLAARPGRAFACGPVRLVGPAGTTIGTGGDLFALAGRLVNADELVDGDGGRDGADAALAILRRRGTDGLAGFRGHFALAYFDAHAARLWLAADHLGRRTVFHARVDGGVAFSSGLRPLLALPDVPRDLDEAFLAATFSDVPPEPDATPYAAIRRIPAATAVAFGVDGERRSHRWWHPDLGHRLRHRRDDDYVEEGRALLDRAVARGLPGSGTVLCQLSGGFDSGAVAATAARLRGTAPVHVLTAAPPDGVPILATPKIVGDERPPARAVAAMHPNMVWESVSSAGLHALDDDPTRLFLALATPARGALGVGWYAPLFERARALGARTVLTGGLGNMTLSWDGLCGLASMARRGDWVRLWREARAIGRLQGRSPVAVLRRHAIVPLLPPRLQARWSAFRGGLPPEGEAFGPIHPEFARAHGIPERRLAFGLDYDGDTDATRRRWLTYVQSNPPTADLTEPLFGVGTYAPLSDVDLLEFCFALPDEQYLRDGRTRWLARRVLADRLPPAVLDETRRGFQCAEFLHRIGLQRERIAAGVADLERSPLASRVLDVGRMRRIVDAPWPTDAARTGFGDYGAVLHRGLHYGRYLRWIEGGNR